MTTLLRELNEIPLALGVRRRPVPTEWASGAPAFLGTEWMRESACLDAKEDFSGIGRGKHAASARKHMIARCHACPVREECLEFALRAEGDHAAQYRYGIFGGLTPTERAEFAS